jgi:hypothetical protein
VTCLDDSSAMRAGIVGGDHDDRKTMFKTGRPSASGRKQAEHHLSASITMVA